MGGEKYIYNSDIYSVHSSILFFIFFSPSFFRLPNNWPGGGRGGAGRGGGRSGGEEEEDEGVCM